MTMTKEEAWEAMGTAKTNAGYIAAYQAYREACSPLERRLIDLEHTNGQAAADERARIERQLRQQEPHAEKT